MADTAKSAEVEIERPFQFAFLVTDYFAVENRTTRLSKWRAPRKFGAARLARNRRLLAAARQAFGLSYYGQQFTAE